MKYNLSSALSNLLAYVAYSPSTLKKLWGGSCLCWQCRMSICQSAVLHTEVPVWLSRPVILSTLWPALEINPITAITHQQTGESINPDQSDNERYFFFFFFFAWKLPAVYLCHFVSSVKSRWWHSAIRWFDCLCTAAFLWSCPHAYMHTADGEMLLDVYLCSSPF